MSGGGIYRELLRKGTVYGLGSSLNGLASLLLIPFFVSRLTAEEFGRFAVTEMIIQLLAIILGLGLNVALLSRYQKLDAEQRRELVRSVFGLLLVTTAAIESVYLAVALTLHTQGMIALDRELLLLVAPITAIEMVWFVLGAVLRGEGAAWRFVIGSSLQVLGSLLGTIVLIVVFNFREEGILYGRLLGDAVFIVYALPHLVRYRPTSRLHEARALLRIGLPLVPAAFASMWVAMAPRYLLQWLSSTSDVGIFAMSSKIASVMSVGFVQPFATVWIVALFKVQLRDDAKHVYARVLTYYLLLGGTLSLGLGLASPSITYWIGRAEFPLSAEIISLVAIGYVTAGLIHPLTIGQYLKERTSLIVPAFALSGILVLPLGYAFTTQWGVFGLCVCLITVNVIQAVVLAVTSHRLYPVRYEWLRLAKMLVAAAASFAIVHGLMDGVSMTIAWLAPVLFALVLAALLIVFRFPMPDELAGVRARLYKAG